MASDEDAEVMVGPVLPMPKRRKTLPFEEQYLKQLPLSDLYEKSYMHRDWVTNIAVSEATGFVITASVDGVVKFWKKASIGIEFAKQFKSHLAPIVGLSVSQDGSLCASISIDKTAKVFDVATFDMIAILKLGYVPRCACWAFKNKSSKHLLAVAERDASSVHIYDIMEQSGSPCGTVAFHSTPVVAMAFNEPQGAVISTDEKGRLLFGPLGLLFALDKHGIKNKRVILCTGMIEYWSPTNQELIKDDLIFSSKFETDLYCLSKSKAVAKTISCSHDGAKFAILSSDDKIRIFRYLDGKLVKVIDESISSAQELQKSGSGELVKGFERRALHRTK